MEEKREKRPFTWFDSMVRILALAAGTNSTLASESGAP